MKKINLNIVLIILLVLMNLFLLYQTQERKNQVTVLKSQLQVSLAGRTDAFLNTTRVSHPQVKLPDSNFLLMIFFPETSCPANLEYEIHKLDSIYQEFLSYIDVYIIGRNDLLLDNYEAKFSASLIHPSLSVFDNEVHFINPFAVLSDQAGNLHAFYLSEVDNYEKSDLFWQRMEVFFKAITKEAPPVPMETDLQ